MKNQPIWVKPQMASPAAATRINFVLLNTAWDRRGRMVVDQARTDSFLAFPCPLEVVK